MNKFNFSFTFYKYYFVDFSKMEIDTGLKFAPYTNILMGLSKIYHTLLYLKIL